MRIHVCGVRGSTPAPGRDFLRYGGHTSCLALAHDGRDPVLVLDAGTGLRRVAPLLGGQAFDGTILLTHLHWDHVQGLPFFGAGDRDDARVTLRLPALEGEGSSSAGRRPDVVGAPGAEGRRGAGGAPGVPGAEGRRGAGGAPGAPGAVGRRGAGGAPGAPGAVEILGRAMSPPHFPITPRGLRGDWSFSTLMPGHFKAEGFTVEAREVPHKGGRTLGYRVSDGTCAIAYIPDHCPTVLGPGPEGWGEYHLAAMELAAGVDLLVHDSFLLAEEVAAEAAFGHAAAEYAVGLGQRGGAKRVMLAHHKPDRTDEELDALALRFAGKGAGVTVAVEGGILDL
jgi:Beta-lactamase superfamily domain/Collagen triple helix repeat (20 copies)